MDFSTDRSVIVVVLTLVMSWIVRSAKFKQLFTRILENGRKSVLHLETPRWRLTSTFPKQFTASNNTNMDTLSDTLLQFDSYVAEASKQNDIVLERSKAVSRESMSQLLSIGYFDKIAKVQNSISANGILLANIIKTTLETLLTNNPEQVNAITELCDKLGYSIQDMKVQKGQSKSTNFSGVRRVNEAISHLCRDYSESFRNEIDPLVQYIESQLSSIPKDDTLLVMPGSGAGYIPLRLSQRVPNVQVDSIELSSMMYLCNEYIFNKDITATISPFAQFYSGQVDSERQVRRIEFTNVTRPTNLNNMWGNFLDYIPKKHYRMIVVNTVYFMDTAENMFEYINKIESLLKYCDELHWINVGPLKYGTAPKVQLTANEFTKLRKIRGWKDISCDVLQNSLNGYLTDLESLYQGYYGLYRFHAIKKKHE